MTDYIKREDAKKTLNSGLRYMRAFGVNRCLTMIDEVPSADVVEVVRCKDCKHYKDNHRCYSKYSNMNDYRSPNDYCSYGERKDD